MRGPDEKTTNLPEPSGPTDNRFVYHLTPAGEKVLSEHQEASGTPLFSPAARSAEITEAVHREAKRRRRKELAQRARGKGRRLGTITYRQRNEQQFPALRVSGRWLRDAGFDLGQEFEITVNDGRLVIEAV